MSGRWHEQSFITPISHRSPSLMKPGTPNTQPSRHIRGLLMVPMAVWRTPPTPIIATTTTHAYHYHITQRPQSPIRLHNQWMQHSRLGTPCNVKIFLKCRLISAALECLHKLNMFINTFFFSSGETSSDGRIINQELHCVLPVNHSAHSWMHSSNNNSARCS